MNLSTKPGGGWETTALTKSLNGLRLCVLATTWPSSLEIGLRSPTHQIPCKVNPLWRNILNLEELVTAICPCIKRKPSANNKDMIDICSNTFLLRAKLTCERNNLKQDSSLCALQEFSSYQISRSIFFKLLVSSKVKPMSIFFLQTRLLSMFTNFIYQMWLLRLNKNKHI